MSDQEFADKRVVVTGAAGVFGRWIAHSFAAQNSRLCLSDYREERLTALANELSLTEDEVIIHPANLNHPNSIDALARLIEERWGAADIVINNAGIYPRRMLLEMSAEEWNEILNVNLTAPFLITQKLASLMIKEKVSGSVINITSGAASTTSAQSGHYSTSKAGLAMLTRAFALELAPYQIRVNAVSPGFSPGSEVSLLTDEYTKNMIDTIPLGRTSGPHDAPEAIMFLCSERASFITGTTLSVDGGRSAGTFRRTDNPSKEGL